MIIVVDGLQLSGKTTLINKFKNYKKLKFDFPYYTKTFNINSDNIGTFQLGKDLSLLYCLKNLASKNVILDRGVFSSIYYSLLYNRLSKEDIIKLFDIIENEYKNINFIFIVKRYELNIDIERNKNDGFDDLDKDINWEILKFIKRECLSREIKFTIFVNDFSKSINENFKLLKGVLNEHN